MIYKEKIETKNSNEKREKYRQYRELDGL